MDIKLKVLIIRTQFRKLELKRFIHSQITAISSVSSFDAKEETADTIETGKNSTILPN